ncbi:hypothetical protein ACP4OV_010362 [Aristida adscensionis]
MVAESVMVSMVGWLASPVINRLIGKAQSYATKKYRWHHDLPGNLESVAQLLGEMSSTVSLVEERGAINDPNMARWLSQLKGAMDEVEDMFDVLDYEILRSNQNQQLEVEDHAGAPGMGLIGTGESSERLKKLQKKLKGIRQSSRGLVQASLLAAGTAAVLVAGAASSSSSSRPATGPLLPPKKPIIGYDEEYEQLLRRLLHQADAEGGRRAAAGDGDDVVAIVGHGGMGKTTLAQRACSDPRVRAHFDIVIWAWVYNKLSEADILGEIWRSAAAAEGGSSSSSSLSSLVRKLRTLELPAIWCWWGALTARPQQAAETTMSFGGMQQALQRLVASRRFLLVLDDVCNDEAATELRRREAWSNVLAPFRHGSRGGSRVLVTTRAKMCARALEAGARRRITLEGVDRDTFLRLLREEAADVPELEEALRRSALQTPAWKSRRSSPLAAKEMAMKLSNTRRGDRSSWEEILSTDCHENVVAAHVSSYRHLPPRLQYCFAFVSLFPDSFQFHPEMLVRMWVGHGFIKDGGGGGGRTNVMEDTARDYFNELLSRSLFRAVREAGKTTHYVVHEQIHSAIRRVSETYFLMIRDSCHAKRGIPPTVRHLSVTTGCLAQLRRRHGVLRTLRTLLVFRDPSSPVTAVGEDLLKELDAVRVLDLSGTDIPDLPGGIGNLIHLRCLALPANIACFSAPVTKLFHLQTLVGRHTHTATSIAQSLAGVQLEFCTKRTGVEQLAGMNSLRGSLSITGLDAVANRQDAQRAHLRRKKHLSVLKFEWDAADEISPPDLDVLEGLQPHTGLQGLHITRYRGASSPSWLADNCLKQLTQLHIKNCRKWELLPPLGHLPRLSHLQIEQMDSVRQIDGGGSFDSLETLVLSDMQNLVHWVAGPTEAGTFTALKSIHVSYCPKLERLPSMPATLKSFEVGRGCPRLRPMPDMPRGEDVYQPMLNILEHL